MEIKLRVTDKALPALLGLQGDLRSPDLRRAVGVACVDLTRRRLLALPPNRRGWPSQGFYRDCARGTYWEYARGGVAVVVENAKRPGAFRQRYEGGTISMKDRMLTIPARAEFYGRSAREFNNLRLVVFGKTGAMALVVGEGGTKVRSRTTGRLTRAKGLGARAQAVVAYWLKEEVEQDGDTSILPDGAEYQAAAVQAVAQFIAPRLRGVRA